MNNDCIFCKIVHRKIPADIIFENKDFLVFKDLYPKATTHLLIIPKQHIDSLSHLQDDHKNLAAEMLFLLPAIAKDVGLTGFRTVINTGAAGGQEIDHLHFHLQMNFHSLLASKQDRRCCQQRVMILHHQLFWNDRD